MYSPYIKKKANSKPFSVPVPYLSSFLHEVRYLMYLQFSSFFFTFFYFLIACMLPESAILSEVYFGNLSLVNMCCVIVVIYKVFWIELTGRALLGSSHCCLPAICLTLSTQLSKSCFHSPFLEFWKQFVHCRRNKS